MTVMDWVIGPRGVAIGNKARRIDEALARDNIAVQRVREDIERRKPRRARHRDVQAY